MSAGVMVSQMDIRDVATLVTALGSLIAAAAALYSVIVSTRTRHAVNGALHDMMRHVRSGAHAEGVKDERDAEHERNEAV